MKLLRYGPKGLEKPGLIDREGRIRDLSEHIADITPTILTTRDLLALSKIDSSTLPIIAQAVRIAPPVANIGKFICVGLNYRDHAAESGMEVPQEPVLFMKATSSIIGCNDPVVLPKNSVKTDWEVELGIVISTPARYVSQEQALQHVAGYCIVNDLSEREYQLERGGQWDKGKGCDTFGPIGPWLVTPDEIPDPQNLELWLTVNNYRFQSGHTSNMIFRVAHLISYISQFMTLCPGDIISTGTPKGVGLGQKPTPIYLAPGDQIHLGIAGLGEQHQTVHAWDDALIDG